MVECGLLHESKFLRLVDSRLFVSYFYYAPGSALGWKDYSDGFTFRSSDNDKIGALFY